MNKAKEIIIGNTYRVVTSPYDPPVECVLDERGVFIPLHDTYQMYEQIRGVYEI